MSTFTYPPPPPPPPPSSSSHQSGPPSQQGRRIPTLHNSNNGRDKRFDGGRGGHQASRGRQHRHHNGQHIAASSGGHVASMNQHYSHTNVQMSVGSQAMYGQAQQPHAQVSAPWTPSQPQQYPSAQALTVPYYYQHNAQHSNAGPSHPSLQSFTPAPPIAQSYPASFANYAPHPVMASGYPPQAPTYPPSNAYPQAMTGPSRTPSLIPSERQPLTVHNQEISYGHGQKRKREQSPHRGSSKPGQITPSAHGARQGKGSGNQIVKPKVLTAPPIPSFGFHALPPRPPTVTAPTGSHARDPKDPKKQKKRKTNQLGLTPKGEVHDVSDEDIDEEAAFVRSGDSQLIEFRGRTVSVSTTAEIQAWIAERKKRFPTAARVAERKAAQETRKKQADEKRKQMLEERQKSARQKQSEQKQAKKAKTKLKTSDETSVDATTKPASALSTEELQRKKLEKHLRKAEKLRHMLENSAIKDEPSSAGKSGNVPEQLSSSNDDSSSASPASDSDAAPDVEPVRRANDQVKFTRNENRNAKAGRNDFTNVPCKYFVRDGHCRRKHCRFLHSQANTAQKKTLSERLKDQEIREESLQVLEIIKQLGDHGSLEPSE